MTASFFIESSVLIALRVGFEAMLDTSDVVRIPLNRGTGDTVSNRFGNMDACDTLPTVLDSHCFPF